MTNYKMEKKIEEKIATDDYWVYKAQKIKAWNNFRSCRFIPTLIFF